MAAGRTSLAPRDPGAYTRPSLLGIFRVDFRRFLVAGFIYLSTDICCRTERRPGGKHDAGGTRPIRHDDVSGGRDRGKHTAKAAGKQKAKKAKPGGECLSGAVSFADAMARGLFSVESLHLMAERGFDVELLNTFIECGHRYL